MSQWYTNPAWYALAVSLIALVVSFLACKHSHRATRSDIQRSLILRATEINEAFLKHGVKGPYAHHLQVSDQKVQEFTAKSVMLLHQINLVREVYEQRDILEKKVVASYINWVTTVLRPWIESDEDLKKSWKLLRDSKDMVGEDFLLWLKPHIPIL